MQTAEPGSSVERAGLGKRHMPALASVALAGPLSVSELAERLGLLSSTSTIVGQLSRAGLLERSEDPDDRRRTIVELHQDYREVVDAWLERVLAPVEEALRRLTPEARGHFMQGWRIIHEEAARVAVPAAVYDCD